jgi:hypothetical protein
MTLPHHGAHENGMHEIDEPVIRKTTTTRNALKSILVIV